MLDNYRSQINQIDDQILQLLDQRFSVTKKVGEYKRENNIEVLNQNREQQIIDKIIGMNLTNEKEVLEMYKFLMDVSKRQQDE